MINFISCIFEELDYKFTAFSTKFLPLPAKKIISIYFINEFIMNKYLHHSLKYSLGMDFFTIFAKSNQKWFVIFYWKNSVSYLFLFVETSEISKNTTKNGYVYARVIRHGRNLSCCVGFRGPQ